MSMPLFYTLCGVSAFALAVALMPAVILLAPKWGLVDEPDARRVNRQAIPRAGGIAIAAAVLCVAGIAVVIEHSWSPAAEWSTLPRQMIVVLGVGAFMFVVGLADDIRSLPAVYKLLALVAGGAALCGMGVSVDALYTQHELYLGLGLLAWPVTILWLAGTTTAVNFIDGLDGLAAGLVALASGVLAAILIAEGETASAAVALALTTALLGFLLFNAHPAKTFMGDSGSMFIGFMIGALGILAAPQIGTMKAMVVPAAALSVPILDTALTIFRRRFVQRRSIFSAERGHIHHQLLELGLSHRDAVLLIYAVSLAATVIAWVAIWADGLAAFGVLSLLVPLLLGFFRAAGSVRSRDMIDAVRQKRKIDREHHHSQHVCDEMQLRFRQVTSFSEWWKIVCEAAGDLNFASVELPLRNRDGSTRKLTWRPDDGPVEDVATLTATVPIRDRRYEQDPLHVVVCVLATTSLESAGQRLAAFSRLMNEHSVADIRYADARSGNGHASHTKVSVLSRIVGWNRIAPPTPRRSWSPEPSPEAAASPVQDLRIAVVHDFLYTYAGAERVLQQILQMYPQAQLFSLFDFLPEDQRHVIGHRQVHTTFLQHMPFARKRHRAYLPLMPLAIEQLDLSSYDLVISSSYLAAKGVITGPDQLHVCYCHSPIRYAWDLQHQYLKQSGIGFGPRGMLARSILHYLRNWDARSALGVDAFVANSRFVARRIQKLYRRDAEVIHPPVDVEQFTCEPEKGDYYVTASRLVPYKRIDMLIEAFRAMPARKLVVIGDGPELARYKQMASPNVTVTGHQSGEQLARHLQRAKAFLFAAEEDFGIAPVEAMACGTPVIAYGHGGATESVIENETGLFFAEQTAESVVAAVERFEQGSASWDAMLIRRHAERFACDVFRTALAQLIDARWAAHAITCGAEGSNGKAASDRAKQRARKETAADVATDPADPEPALPTVTSLKHTPTG